MKELIDLIFTFAKIGGTTFGGGYAMLPILQREIVEKRTYIRNRRLERGQLIMKMGNRKSIMKSGKRVTDYDK